MKTTDVSEKLIGQKVKCIFTGLEVHGTITGIVVNTSKNHSKLVEQGYEPYMVCSKGVRIKFDSPVQWGDCSYEEYESTSRVHDEFGNLNYTELI